MFHALLLEKDDAGFRAGVQSIDEARLPRGRRAGPGRALDAQLQGRPGDHQPGPVVRSWPMVAGIDGAGTVLREPPSDWKAGDRVVAQRLGRRRDALGLPGASRRGCRGDGLVAAAVRLLDPAGDGASAPPATPRCCACWRSSGTG